MHADLSRLTFRPAKHYSGVLAQQGRVQLDADANEQAAITRHQARTLAADLIGQHGGPHGATGFRIEFRQGENTLDDLVIHGGRYYVDGILCDAGRPPAGTPAEHEPTGAADAPAGAEGPEGDAGGEQGPPADGVWTYWDQPDAYRDAEKPADRLPAQLPYLVYLKVWERTVTAAEDPEIREVALGAALPDTAARIKTVWQVLPLTGTDLGAPESPTSDQLRTAFRAWADKQRAPAAAAAFRTERPARTDEDPCVTPPDSRYRGPENQLYRVEVHTGGTSGTATFKWSRENGSVVFPVAALDGTWVELTTLGQDDKLDLNAGDRVELADSAYTSRGEPADLLRVEEVDLPGRRVRLDAEPGPGTGRLPGLHPFLRRWDHRAPGGRGTARQDRDGGLKLVEGAWTDLEDGVQVWFAPGGRYRPGDHWTVPARTATGTVEWPATADARPLLQPPAGIEAHYAPLAWVVGGEASQTDLRFSFRPLAAPVEAVAER
ncbi:hypothetical protein SMD11_0443 [Streptomyces albireticuli]|uniref:Uncharacterized protein n=1 Tax=Streptomyces albireticuli TaxID=1940 RepID=A0A1Z2KVQ2_9ACTN|nr:DUF6519 domain-containing protein [Streptomyces albireticuli]ARZ66109.1 hypothetical protein SMD11_0443 [Streptomyces albireticuli]